MNQSYIHIHPLPFALSPLSDHHSALPRVPCDIAALFTTAQTRKQPKHSATEKRVKMWCVYTILLLYYSAMRRNQYFSAIKSKEIGSFVEIWMNPESVIQCEVSQKEKNRYCILMHMCRLQKNGTDDPIYEAEIET